MSQVSLMLATQLRNKIPTFEPQKTLKNMVKYHQKLDLEYFMQKYSPD